MCTCIIASVLCRSSVIECYPGPESERSAFSPFLNFQRALDRSIVVWCPPNADLLNFFCEAHSDLDGLNKYLGCWRSPVWQTEGKKALSSLILILAHKQSKLCRIPFWYSSLTRFLKKNLQDFPSPIELAKISSWSMNQHGISVKHETCFWWDHLHTRMHTTDRWSSARNNLVTWSTVWTLGSLPGPSTPSYHFAQASKAPFILSSKLEAREP